jgi:predicted P-loop ATPase
MTKEQLLNKVSVTQIYTKFFKDYKTGSNVSSPFTSDKKASFRFYKNETFKCFSSGHQGDVFQFVADLNQLNCKENFNDVLDIICKAFSLNGHSKTTQIKKVKTQEKDKIKTVNSSTHFSYNTKEFESIHLSYFSQGNWNVTKEILVQYNVSALDKFQYWNSKKKGITKIKLFKDVLGFVYKVNQNVELYVPKQEKTSKFFFNQLDSKDVFGLSQLKKNEEFIIVSAGKKDCLILNANGFPSVCFRSENHFISKEQIKELHSYTKTIIVCYDNDMSGINASKQLVEKYNLLELALPNKYNDVADFFNDNNKGDYNVLISNVLDFSNKQEVVKKKDKQKGTTIFHIVEEYLSKHYEFRFNTILLDIEYKPKTNNSKWSICNEDSLFIEMQKKGINIQMAKLISILKSNFVPKYNPIHSYFRGLRKWDGKDYISQLVNYVTTPSPKEFSYHLTKWLARSVKCMLVDGYFNKQAFIITDKGNGQNIGKSHFTKWLCPPSLPLNRSFEDSKKDNLIKLATNAFIILDELDGISRKDLNSLKALFSMDEIRVRLPYARREETVQRTANFIGSTNEENFLNDPTGSVRWLVFNVTAIDWNYSKVLDINNIWAQAYALAKDVNFDETFTKEDVKQNEARNETYQIRSPEAEMISLLYEIPNETNKSKVIFLTSTEILIYLKANSSLNRLSPVSVGKALKLLKFQRVKKNGVYGYNVAQTHRVLGIENQNYKTS